MHTLGNYSAFVNPAGQLLVGLTRWGKTRMDDVGIVFEFYTGPLEQQSNSNTAVSAAFVADEYSWLRRVCRV